MNLRDVPWLSLLLAALCGWLGHRIGFDVGRRTERLREWIVVESDAAARTHAALAARNAVWRTLNGDDVPDGPERRLGNMLLSLLHPSANEDDLHRGLSAFRRKGEAYLTPEERERATLAFTGTSLRMRLVTLRELLSRDGRAHALLQTILDDESRIDLVLRGERVPLEASMDGSFP